MKTKLLPKIILGLAAIAVISAAPRASAVPVTFAGGGGTPLSFTLSQPVTYTITGTSGTAPLFVFQNVFAGTFSFAVSGSVALSINGGPAQSWTPAYMNLGNSGGSITVNDLYFSVTLPLGFMVGDVVVITGGTLTTSGNVLGMPASGNFNTFITDGLANRVSADGTTGSSVPETLSTLWLGLPLLGMFAARRFRSDAPGH